MQKLLIGSKSSSGLRLALLWGLSAGLPLGCSVIPAPWAYQIDIQQGNIITQDMMDQLKPGMGPQEVRTILGTPMVTDPFHPERWDYIYNFQPGGKRRQQRRITVVFENDRLARVEGDVQAQGQ
jgi:outer membrane protein assembly factor BamE